jgi:hypothetical protein
MNVSKLIAIVDLFRKGSEVSNKEAWKKGQITATALGGVLIAGVQVANTFGITPSIPDDVLVSIAGGIIVIVNFVGTLITSSSVGILPEKKD